MYDAGTCWVADSMPKRLEIRNSMISSDERSRNILQSWIRERTPLTVLVDSEGIAYNGVAILTELEPEGVEFSIATLGELTVRVSADGTASRLPSESDPDSVEVSISSRWGRCLIRGSRPKLANGVSK